MSAKQEFASKFELIALSNSVWPGFKKHLKHCLLARDLDTHNANGTTLLGLAAHAGHIKAVELLLQLGADANVCMVNGRKETALMIAAKAGHTCVTERLIDGGAHINTVDGENFSAAYHAAAADQWEALNVLVEHGCDAAHVPSALRRTIVQLAATADQFQTVLKLCMSGVTIKPRDLNCCRNHRINKAIADTHAMQNL